MRALGANRKVLAVGVYLCDVKNHAVEISRELSRAEEWNVEQQGIAVGKSALPDSLAPLTAWRQRSRAAKFVLLNRLLGTRDLGRYDFVIICDDDITLPERFVDRYLDVVDRVRPRARPARPDARELRRQLHRRAARRARRAQDALRRDRAALLDAAGCGAPPHAVRECSPMGCGYDFV